MAGGGYCETEGSCAGSLRVSNAVWDPARFATEAGGGRLPGPRVRAVWERLVSLLHAAAGRTARQLVVCCAERVAGVTGTRQPRQEVSGRGSFRGGQP